MELGLHQHPSMYKHPISSCERIHIAKFNPQLSPPPPRQGGLFISNKFGRCLIEMWGLLERGGSFNLTKMMVSVLHKKLEYKVEKLKYKKLEVMQPRIKNKSELPVVE